MAGNNHGEDRRDFGICYEALGHVLQELNQTHEAEEAYRGALSVWDKRVANFHGEDDRWHLAVSGECLGNLLRAAGQLEKAAEAYRGALTVWESLVAEFNRADQRNHLSWTQGWLIEALVGLANQVEKDAKLLEADRKAIAQGYRDKAIEAYRQSSVVDEKLLRDFPDDPQYFWRILDSHTNLGGVFIGAGRMQEGERFYAREVESHPEEAGPYFRRGEFYARLGLWDEAARDFAQAFKLGPPATPRQCLVRALERVRRR